MLAHADASLQQPLAVAETRAKLAILLFDLAATGVTRNALMLSASLADTADVTLIVVSRNGVLAPLVDPRVRLLPCRRGGKVALVVTEGFRDLIEIGRQIRPHVFSLQEDYPTPLVPRCSGRVPSPGPARRSASPPVG